MADIQFCQEESEDPQDEGDVMLDDVSSECGGSSDDELSALQKLERYIDSDSIYSRQIVVRSLLETIRSVGQNCLDAAKVLAAVSQLAADTEPLVRTELMEQVPHFAMFCHEHPDLFDNPVHTHILPIVIKYLTDCNNQVRKTSQAALLVLLEHDLLDRDDVDALVCPVIMELANPDSFDEFRTEAVALMSKMAPLVGRETTQRVFLARFAEMCSDGLFHVRKVCAENFGDLCGVVGQHSTETLLLPRFCYLCEDAVWGVRKACAECFMDVSCSCSADVRHTELAHVFIALICDQSRWVRIAAFQALGGFISTFADPATTGLYFNEGGCLVVGSADEFTSSRKCTVDADRDELASEGSDDTATSVCDTTTSGEDASGDDATTASSGDAVTTKGDTVTSGGDVATCESDMAMSEDDTVTSGDDAVTSMDDSLTSESDTVMSSVDTSSEGDGATPPLPPIARTMPSVVVTEPDVDTAVMDMDVDVAAVVRGDGGDRSDTSCEQRRADAYERAAGQAGGQATGQAAEKRDGHKLEPDGGSKRLKSDIACTGGATCGQPTPTDERPCACRGTLPSAPPAAPASYNSFQYWRNPLPDVDLSPAAAAAASGSTPASEGDEPEPPGGWDEAGASEGGGDAACLEAITAELRVGGGGGGGGEIHTAAVETSATPAVETVANFGSTHVLGQHVSETTLSVVGGVVHDLSDCNVTYSLTEDGDDVSTERIPDQDVIPQVLLDHYLSMTDPSRAQMVDSEIAKHCAYSLPAVAYTLGRRHWPCLKQLYETLASDMQWKVRRTLAFSIHELGAIVGEEITSRDLVPVFNGFLRDLDEVRIGLLKHLADFLKILKPDVRQEYLSKMSDFLHTDNNRNWRFREELSEQLSQLAELFEPADVYAHILPLVLTLVEDQVAAVHLTSIRVLSVVVSRLAEDDDEAGRTMLDAVLTDLTGRFLSPDCRASRRQTYAQICQSMLETRALPDATFAERLLPDLIILASDRIVNVRIGVARALARQVLVSAYLMSTSNRHLAALDAAVTRLRGDRDRDVRDFINWTPDSELAADHQAAPLVQVESDDEMQFGYP